ncbi:MAG: c-type cytochrome, partial [Planctomycetaceae bacterium]|nr:c-type cytochrome [Planctomycetaceae bacterium]
SLRASIRKSLKDTMSSMVPVTEEDVEDVYAYLASLEVPAAPQPPAGSPEALSLERGQQLFAGKAGCVTCHQGERLTADLQVKTGLESSRDFYEGYNPPSLRGLRNRRRFLHDGRGHSLEEVLTVYHQPQQLAGEELTAEELADLIRYLKSL